MDADDVWVNKTNDEYINFEEDYFSNLKPVNSSNVGTNMIQMGAYNIAISGKELQIGNQN
jgi:hypothetical protein